MKNGHNGKKFDDTEICSKIELFTELQACQIDLAKQDQVLRDTQLKLEQSHECLTKQHHNATVDHLTPNKTTKNSAVSQTDYLAEPIDLHHELLLDSRRLTQNLFKRHEDERRLLACELHDELGQWLTAIYAEAETIAILAHEDLAIHTSAKAISECTKKIHQVIHEILLQLRPALLDTLGLADALYELKKNWSAHHAHITLDLKLTGSLDNLGEPINTTLFRVVQEALNNICSHAQATQAQVILSREAGVTFVDDFLLLHVADNGKGYDLEQSSKGFGLLGMRERTIAAGGEFTTHSKPLQGTQIHVRLPLNNANKSMGRRFNDR